MISQGNTLIIYWVRTQNVSINQNKSQVLTTKSSLLILSMMMTYICTHIQVKTITKSYVLQNDGSEEFRLV